MARDARRQRLRDQILAGLQQPAPPGQAAAATATLDPPSARSRHEPFPLLDLQQAYWIGREHGPHPIMAVRPGGQAVLVVADAPEPPGETVRRIIEDIAAEPMDLGHGPLLRVAVVRLRDGWAGALVVHHIVSDDYSIRLVCGQILECYTALSRTGRLPPGWAAGREVWPAIPPPSGPGEDQAGSDRVRRRREALTVAGAPRLPAPRPVPGAAPWAGSGQVRVLGGPARQARARARGVTTLVLTLALAGLAVAAAGGPPTCSSAPPAPAGKPPPSTRRPGTTREPSWSG